mgnify:CR=1 FL=1
MSMRLKTNRLRSRRIRARVKIRQCSGYLTLSVDVG